jgi:hypothetical protein
VSKGTSFPNTPSCLDLADQYLFAAGQVQCLFWEAEKMFVVFRNASKVLYQLPVTPRVFEKCRNLLSAQQRQEVLAKHPSFDASGVSTETATPSGSPVTESAKPVQGSASAPKPRNTRGAEIPFFTFKDIDDCKVENGKVIVTLKTAGNPRHLYDWNQPGLVEQCSAAGRAIPPPPKVAQKGASADPSPKAPAAPKECKGGEACSWIRIQQSGGCTYVMNNHPTRTIRAIVFVYGAGEQQPELKPGERYKLQDVTLNCNPAWRSSDYGAGFLN